MSRCPGCGVEATDGKRFCAECGASLIASAVPTATSVPSQVPTPQTSSGPRDPSSGARFLPGAMLAGRYRIVGLLGRGGMGEVYRADDLKLGQPVALKLLPPEVAGDPTRLDRFLNEVRLALKVTHSNVCRVFDIGEVDGQHFLSMEYVDGENLQSLLRRIGRLPEDKAVQIARQLCAGLAAAHDQGVLHRDLKPANVMIDGRGRAKITDFGLAGATRGIRGVEARAGTPGYMAPEQLAGDELSERTDIYALGLVLYELFTGKPAFKPASPAEMARLQRETTPDSLASHVDSLDPAVERGIMRCLETEPAKRPNSALSVAAGLPGGDPLAAALAAGETPSPEMVVAGSEEEGRLSRGIAGLLLGVLGICLVGSLFLADFRSLASRVALPKEPEVLREEARQLIEALGYDTEGNDHIAQFSTDGGYLDYLRQENEGPDRWEALRTGPPSAVHFLYRQSPNTLRPVLHDTRVLPVSRTNTTFEPGMIDVSLDHDGRLVEFRAAPRLFERDSTEVTSTGSVNPGVEWADLFDRAGLDFARFEEPPEPLAPRRNFRIDCDERRSWIGTLSNENPISIRVEGGAIDGRVAAFEVLFPWQLPTVQNPGASTARGILDVIALVISIAIFIAPLLIGFRHLRLGRGDRRGATVVAATILTSSMLWWLLSVSRFPEVVDGILNDFFLSLAASFFWGALGWIFYVALEPYLRRRWPHRIVSWARLIAGRWKDPLVGRDLLVGLSVGSALAVGGASIIHLVQGGLDLSHSLHSFSGDLSIRDALGSMSLTVLLAVTMGLAAVILPILLQFVVRKMSLALVLTWFLFAFISVDPAGHPDVHWTVLAAIAAIRAGVFVYLLSRFGLLAGTAALYAGMVLSLQGSSSIGAWYATPLLTVIVVLALIGGYGFFTSLAGRPMFRDDVA